MDKFKRDTLPVNFKPFFTWVNIIQNYSKDFQRQIIISLEWIVFMVLKPYLILDVKNGRKF